METVVFCNGLGDRCLLVGAVTGVLWLVWGRPLFMIAWCATWSECLWMTHGWMANMAFKDLFFWNTFLFLFGGWGLGLAVVHIVVEFVWICRFKEKAWKGNAEKEIERTPTFTVKTAYNPFENNYSEVEEMKLISWLLTGMEEKVIYVIIS